MLKIHALADLFPSMSKEQFVALREDIRANGVREPAYIWNDEIIDGRHRALVCDELGIELPTREFEGDEAAAVALVVSLNSARRDMNQTQRAMVAARLVTTQWGGNNKQEANLPLAITLDQAAERLGVSVRLVKSARVVLTKGAPDLIEACDAGLWSVADVEKIVRTIQSNIMKDKRAAIDKELDDETAAERAAKELETLAEVPITRAEVEAERAAAQAEKERRAEEDAMKRAEAAARKAVEEADKKALSEKQAQNRRLGEFGKAVLLLASENDAAAALADEFQYFHGAGIHDALPLAIKCLQHFQHEVADNDRARTPIVTGNDERRTGS